VQMRGACACLLAITLLSSGAHAHGALRLNKTLCVLRIGPDTIHFSGYQPLVSTDEFCEDIPQVGSAVFALDYVDSELRDMTAEIRIIKDLSNGGLTGKPATLTDEELSSTDLGPITETYLPAKRYPHGTVNFQHFFAKAGKYIGIVTVRNSHGQFYVAQFPFSVGQGYLKILPYYIVLVAMVLGGLVVYSKYGRQVNVPPPKRPG
jgi:hypothetical protein